MNQPTNSRSGFTSEHRAIKAAILQSNPQISDDDFLAQFEAECAKINEAIPPYGKINELSSQDDANALLAVLNGFGVGGSISIDPREDAQYDMQFLPNTAAETKRLYQIQGTVTINGATYPFRELVGKLLTERDELQQSQPGGCWGFSLPQGLEDNTEIDLHWAPAPARADGAKCIWSDAQGGRHIIA